MAKVKLKPVIKTDGNDVYKFINGVAVVPGVHFKKQPMLITLREFNELKQEALK